MLARELVAQARRTVVSADAHESAAAAGAQDERHGERAQRCREAKTSPTSSGLSPRSRLTPSGVASAMRAVEEGLKRRPSMDERCFCGQSTGAARGGRRFGRFRLRRRRSSRALARHLRGRSGRCAACAEGGLATPGPRGPAPQDRSSRSRPRGPCGSRAGSRPRSSPARRPRCDSRPGASRRSDPKLPSPRRWRARAGSASVLFHTERSATRAWSNAVAVSTQRRGVGRAQRAAARLVRRDGAAAERRASPPRRARAHRCARPRAAPGRARPRGRASFRSAVESRPSLRTRSARRRSSGASDGVPSASTPTSSASERRSPVDHCAASGGAAALEPVEQRSRARRNRW